jgi:hypothetical protein
VIAKDEGEDRINALQEFDERWKTFQKLKIDMIIDRSVAVIVSTRSLSYFTSCLVHYLANYLVG